MDVPGVGKLVICFVNPCKFSDIGGKYGSNRGRGGSLRGGRGATGIRGGRGGSQYAGRGGAYSSSYGGGGSYGGSRGDLAGRGDYGSRGRGR